MNKAALKFWGPLVAAALILGSVASYIGGTSFCSSEGGVSAIRQNGSAGCLEFWLNRYQTLISGFLSVAAAVIAAILLWRQLWAMGEHRTEMEKTRALQLYSATIERSKDLGKFSPMQVRMASLFADMNEVDLAFGLRQGPPADAPQRILNGLKDLEATSSKIIEALRPASEQYWGGPSLHEHLGPVLEALRNIPTFRYGLRYALNKASLDGRSFNESPQQQQVIDVHAEGWGKLVAEFRDKLMAFNESVRIAKRRNHELAARLEKTAMY